MSADNQFDSRRARRLLRWEQDGDGRVIVFRPRFGSSSLGRRFAAWLGVGDYKIRLDEIGSAVWMACDGETEMGQIAAALRHEFGERVEPADELLQQFVSQMYRAKMIDL